LLVPAYVTAVRARFSGGPMPRACRVVVDQKRLLGLPVSSCGSPWGAPSEFEARADGGRDERLAKASTHSVLGPPSGAVGRDDDIRSKGATVVEDEGMRGSKIGPLRWNPPMTAWRARSLVRRRAYRQMLTIPAWPQPAVCWRTSRSRKSWFSV